MIQSTSDAVKVLYGLYHVPKHHGLEIDRIQPFENGFSARLITHATKATVKKWLKKSGITQYRLQEIRTERCNYFRIEFEITS